MHLPTAAATVGMIASLLLLLSCMLYCFLKNYSQWRNSRNANALDRHLQAEGDRQRQIAAARILQGSLSNPAASSTAVAMTPMASSSETRPFLAAATPTVAEVF